MSPEDSFPAVLVWAPIDDFLIHGPTYENTARAMQALMDKALDIELLFNPMNYPADECCQVLWLYLRHEAHSRQVLRHNTFSTDSNR
jgi:hypothetical protein